MRTWKMILYWALAALPLCVVLLLLPGVPEQIPMQYSASGEIFRVGQKYELLFLPALTFLIAAFLYLLGYAAAKKSARGEQNRKTLYSCGNILSVCFGILSVVITYYAGHGTVNINQTYAFEILSFILSVMLLLMGNLMPKCKRNDKAVWLSVGFRTPWARKDDEVWRRTNRIGGYCIAVAGAVGIAVSLLVPGMASLIIVVSLLTLAAISGSIYSWAIYRKLCGHASAT